MIPSIGFRVHYGNKSSTFLELQSVVFSLARIATYFNQYFNRLEGSSFVLHARKADRSGTSIALLPTISMDRISPILANDFRCAPGDVTDTVILRNYSAGGSGCAKY